MSMKFVLVISSEIPTILTLSPLGNFHAFLSSADFFKIYFSKNSRRSTRVSNSLDPDQTSFVRPDQAFRFMVGLGHCPIISKYGPSLSKAVGHIGPVILFGILGRYLFLHIWENILLELGK